MASNVSVIVDNLTLLRDVNKKEKNTFKVRAYNKVIQTVTRFVNGNPNGVIRAEDVANMGLSDAMQKKVLEIIETGKLHQVQNLSGDVLEETQAVATLTKVQGIGAVKAGQLYSKHGIKTVDDLRKKVAGSPEILNDNQLVGLKHFDDLLKRIPRAEMTKHNALIGDFMGCNEYEVVGSYRRGEKTSGDIDVLVRLEPNEDKQSTIDRIVQDMKARKYIQDVFAHGEKKFMGVCKLPRHRTSRHIDIIVVDENSYPFTVLYFTGSDRFNIRMRQHALEMGFSMNEYGLTPTTKEAKARLVGATFAREQDIFAFLNMEYVEPTQRSM